MLNRLFQKHQQCLNNVNITSFGGFECRLSRKVRLPAAIKIPAGTYLPADSMVPTGNKFLEFETLHYDEQRVPEIIGGSKIS